jgi:hypothetical protein
VTDRALIAFFHQPRFFGLGGIERIEGKAASFVVDDQLQQLALVHGGDGDIVSEIDGAGRLEAYLVELKAAAGESPGPGILPARPGRPTALEIALCRPQAKVSLVSPLSSRACSASMTFGGSVPPPWTEAWPPPRSRKWQKQ